MNAPGTATGDRGRTRQELIHQYVRLQRELVEGDPASSSYQSTIHAFRQMGYSLISSGFEDDLDRLLRLRVLDGGRASRSPRHQRPTPNDLVLIERKPAR